MKNLFDEEIQKPVLLDRGVLAKVFHKCFSESDERAFAGMLTNPFEAIISFAKLCQLPPERLLPTTGSLITSPPYYDTERYSDELTQSCNRYKSYEEWVEKFFTVLIRKTMAHLKSGAVFALNTCDRKYALSKEIERIVPVGIERPPSFISRYIPSAGMGKDRTKCERLFLLRKPK